MSYLDQMNAWILAHPDATQEEAYIFSAPIIGAKKKLFHHSKRQRKMNNELKISAKEAREAYNKADAAGKELLENLFGKETFAPKDITERVKTLADALMILGEDHIAVKEYRLLERFIFSENLAEDILAFAKLRVIASALNEGWRPTHSKVECSFSPRFITFSQEQYKEFNDDDKDVCYVNHLSGDPQETIGIAYVGDTSMFTLRSCESRILFKTERLAVYCGKQFIDIWAKYLLA